MNPRLLVALCLCAALFTDANAQTAAGAGLRLPEAASSELREAIRNSPRRSLADLPDPPGTPAEWRAMIEPVKERRAALVPAMLESSGVELRRDKVADVAVHYVQPADGSAANEKRLFVYMHGGGFVFGGGDSGIVEAILIAERTGIPVLSVDYRMPPDHPAPAALDDVIAVYKDLLATRDAGSIVLGGTSAGGGLALSAVQQFRNLGLPMPGAIYAGAPWADLTKTGDTMFTNETLDRVLFSYDRLLGAAARLYAGDQDMKDPSLSPVYGEFAGFPPTFLVTGTRDLMLSDVVRTHRKLRDAGAVADLNVFEGMSHQGYLTSPNTPESMAMYRELKTFIDRYVGQPN